MTDLVRDSNADRATAEGPLLTLGEGVHALFTSRLHGNLSSVSGDGREQGALARMRLRDTLGLRRLVRGYQVHGTVVGRVHRYPHRPGGQNGLSENGPSQENGLSHDDSDGSQPSFHADGHAVAAPGIAAMVLVADCLPVVLATRGAVAALHAGWRGLAAGVLEEGVRALRDVGGEGPIAAAIGPCAGACCYEVGEEVFAALEQSGTVRPRASVRQGAAGAAAPPGRGGPFRKGKIDLRSIARERLLAAGVEEAVDVGGCTICDTRYFSHRREGARAGRQAALAWLS